MTLKSDAKLEEKLTCGFENDMRNISPEYLKVSKLVLLGRWDPFIQSKKCMSFKFTEDLCVITMNNDAKFEEELTCRFKIDMRNLTNFDQSTHKFQKLVL